MAARSPREASVVGAITRLLAARHAWHVKVHGSRYGRAGIPDLLVCYRGRFVAIEVKRPRASKTSALQEVELARIERSGGTAIVATSAADVAAILDQIDQPYETFLEAAAAAREALEEPCPAAPSSPSQSPLF